MKAVIGTIADLLPRFPIVGIWVARVAQVGVKVVVVAVLVGRVEVATDSKEAVDIEEVDSGGFRWRREQQRTEVW